MKKEKKIPQRPSVGGSSHQYPGSTYWLHSSARAAGAPVDYGKLPNEGPSSSTTGKSDPYRTHLTVILYTEQYRSLRNTHYCHSLQREIQITTEHTLLSFSTKSNTNHYRTHLKVILYTEKHRSLQNTPYCHSLQREIQITMEHTLLSFSTKSNTDHYGTHLNVILYTDHYRTHLNAILYNEQHRVLQNTPYCHSLQEQYKSLRNTP